MIITDNEEIAEKAQSLKDLAFSKDRRFLHTDLGFNYRMTNIQAAIGLAQFERIYELVEMLRRNLIEDEFGLSMANLATELEKKGIETRTFFIPIHKQPVFQRMGLFKGEIYPVAEELARKGMYLPSSSGLKAEEIKKVVQGIVEVQRREA